MIVLIGMGVSWWTNDPKVMPAAEAGWWNDNWSYRKAIVINHEQVTGDLTDFPILASTTDAQLGTHAQADGDDIVFIDSNGRKLAHEIEYYDGTKGDLVAWWPWLACWTWAGGGG